MNTLCSDSYSNVVMVGVMSGDGDVGEAILNNIDALKELSSLEDISNHVMQSRDKGCTWTGEMFLRD